MPRYGQVRVVLDEKALTLARREAGRGLLAVAEDALARAVVPDQPPYGVGLVKKGAAVAYVDGEKVGGNADLPAGESTDGMVAYVGFDFPARFQEIGTVHQPARPFLSPAVDAAAAHGAATIARTVKLPR